MKLTLVKIMILFLKQFPIKNYTKLSRFVFIHCLVVEIQHHHIDDSYLSHDFLVNIGKSQTPKFDKDSVTLTEISHSNAIIQIPIKSPSKNSLPFLIPHYLLNLKLLKNSFFPLHCINMVETKSKTFFCNPSFQS